MHLDDKRFPRAEAYLQRLPAGLGSHSECLARREAFDDLRADFPALAALSDLPAPLQTILDGRSREQWVPEVAGMTLLQMARDTFESDAAFLDWCYEHNRKLFNRPLFRALIHVLSTTLLVMGATKRWSHFHQGTSLTPAPVVVQGGRSLAKATLEFPLRLYDDLLLAQYGQAFLAAVNASGPKDSRIDIEGVTETRAVFLVSWSK